MSISKLKTLAANYEDGYVEHSDSALIKVILGAVVSAFVKLNTKVDELDTKIDALEARVEALES